MYDILIYPYIPRSPEEKSGYIVEYDPRAASAGGETSTSAQQASPKHPTPTIMSMMKRYILRSKVRVRDVSENWDVWAIWGSSLPQSVNDIARPDDWRWGRSGAVEPIYHDAERAPVDRVEAQTWLLGQDSQSGPPETEAIWMVDRRAPGMGIRALLPKGAK
ncbi:ccr4 associated factor, partial [Tulasnella sp. 408]